MVDPSPEIWQNKTLGEAVNLPFLDEEEAQLLENQAARREKRVPRTAVRRPRFPAETSFKNRPSYATDITYADFFEEYPEVDSSGPELVGEAIVPGPEADSVDAPDSEAEAE